LVRWEQIQEEKMILREHHDHMIEIETDLKTDTGIAMLANSITLTPGTVTVEAHKDGRFLVHAIAMGPAEGLLEGTMQAKVKAVEGGED